MRAERITTPLVVSKSLAERLDAISRSALAQRMVLEAAIERAIEVEGERIRAAWDERVRKQAARFGWRWRVTRYG